jgi:MFS family permease
MIDLSLEYPQLTVLNPVFEPHRITLLAVAFLAAGVGIGAVETAEHAAVAALAPTHLRGSAFGVLAAVQATGNFVASAVAGLLWTLVSPHTAFLVSRRMDAAGLARAGRQRTRHHVWLRLRPEGGDHRRAR